MPEHDAKSDGVVESPRKYPTMIAYPLKQYRWFDDSEPA